MLCLRSLMSNLLVLLFRRMKQFYCNRNELTIFFSSEKKNTIGYIGQVYEGRYINEKWVTTRMMNGDETYHNSRLRVFGRTFETTKDIVKETKKEGEPDAYSPATKQSITTPGIYKVTTYER